MAISKRMRFEILRRDGFKCTYCHASEALLTVDHVTPVSLGGTDHPSNLVACCDDCNTGKSSTLAAALPSSDALGSYETVISAAVFIWCDHWMPMHQRHPTPEHVARVRQRARELYPEHLSASALLLGAEASGGASGLSATEVWDLQEAFETQQQHDDHLRTSA